MQPSLRSCSCLLALAPTVILVGLLQKYIVEGLAAGDEILVSKP